MTDLTDSYARNVKKPVPINLDKYLNEDQLFAIKILSKVGWSIYFVRRPKFISPTIVMIEKKSKDVGLLKNDGYLDTHTHISMRKDVHYNVSNELAS